jgi:hypothetical protein
MIPQNKSNQNDDLHADVSPVDESFTISEDHEYNYTNTERIPSIEREAQRSTYLSPTPLQDVVPPKATISNSADPGAEPLMYAKSTTKDTTADSNREAFNTRSLHLVAPVLMITTFLFGIAFSLGHHFYYLWLDGQIVRSTNHQQWALR